MERIEMVYRGVRETERSRRAVVILVHMLYVARQAGLWYVGAGVRP